MSVLSRMMVRQSLIPVAIGLVVGLGLSLALGAAMRGVLYDAQGADPLTVALVMTILGGIAFLASYLPAARASGVDPVDALRAE